MSADAFSYLPTVISPLVREGGDYSLMPSPQTTPPSARRVFSPYSEDDSPGMVIPNRITMELGQDLFPITPRALLTPRGTSRVDLGGPVSPDESTPPEIDLPLCRGNCLSSFLESVAKKVKALASKCCLCGTDSAKAQSPQGQELSNLAVSKTRQRKESRYGFKNDKCYEGDGSLDTFNCHERYHLKA